MILVRLRLAPLEREGQFRVTVEEAPGGEPSQDTSLPFEGKRLGTLLKSVHLDRYIPGKFENPGEQDWMKEQRLLTEAGDSFSENLYAIIGQWLYDSLFPESSQGERNSVRTVFESALLDAERSGQQLHIQLVIEADKAGRLADYPWELMHDGRNFLALRQVDFSRYIAYDSPRPNLPPTERLNVLLTSPNPTVYGLLPLGEQEQKAIHRGLEKVAEVKIQEPDAPTFDSLRRYLADHSRTDAPHVIHFNGHGVFGKLCRACNTMNTHSQDTTCRNSTCRRPLPERQGYLVFDNGFGGAHYVSAKEFSELVHSASLRDSDADRGGVTLIVLSACQSAVAIGGRSIFNGVAQSLIGNGVPAVVAMQFPVEVEAASRFAEQFYRSVGQQESLSLALRKARGAMGEEGNQWYRPVLYLRWEANDGGQLFVEPSQRRIPFELYSFIVLVALLLAVIAIAYGVYHSIFGIPVPEVMQGDFNVAVAEFTVVNQEGAPIDTELGIKKAEQWFDALDEELADLTNYPGFPSHDIWPPELTGEILGDDPRTRAEFAKERAKEIKAHVIVYGVITMEGSDATVEPEFFVSAAGFDRAPELVGQYAFGKSIRFALGDQEFEVNSRLVNRIKALSLIAVGMAFYADGNFEQAEGFLQDANEYVGDDEGRDVVYLLIGNTYLLRSSERHPDSFLDQAAEYYGRALNTECGDCTRARPMLGNLIISQRKALGNLDDVTFPQGIDAGELAYVISGYETILLLDSTSYGANIETKAHLGLGQAHQFLAIKQTIDCQCAVGFEQAIHYLELVVKDYESGNDTAQELASKAFVSLGWIAQFQNREEAPMLYQNAAVLAADHDKAKYFYWVGSSYENVHRDVLACEAYERCHSFAEEYSRTDDEELCLNAQEALNCANVGGYDGLDYSPEYTYYYPQSQQ